MTPTASPRTRMVPARWPSPPPGAHWAARGRACFSAGSSRLPADCVRRMRHLVRWVAGRRPHHQPRPRTFDGNLAGVLNVSRETTGGAFSVGLEAIDGGPASDARDGFSHTGFAELTVDASAPEPSLLALGLIAAGFSIAGRRRLGAKARAEKPAPGRQAFVSVVGRSRRLSNTNSGNPVLRHPRPHSAGGQVCAVALPLNETCRHCRRSRGR